MENLLAQQLTLPGLSGGTQTIHGPQGLTFNNIGDVVNASLQYIFVFAGIGLLLMIISAGYQLLTSAGDPKKLEGGKQRLVSAVIGFVIILAAFWVTQIAGAIFGFTEISNSF